MFVREVILNVIESSRCKWVVYLQSVGLSVSVLVTISVAYVYKQFGTLRSSKNSGIASWRTELPNFIRQILCCTGAHRPLYRLWQRCIAVTKHIILCAQKLKIGCAQKLGAAAVRVKLRTMSKLTPTYLSFSRLVLIECLIEAYAMHSSYLHSSLLTLALLFYRLLSPDSLI